VAIAELVMPRHTAKRGPRTRDAHRRLDERLDEALTETFPASDPIAVGEPTGTERPRRPVDRTSPLLDLERSGTRLPRKRGSKG
jgi:hypothetical protein